MKKSEMALKKYLIQILENEGWKYEILKEDIICVISYQNKKWTMVYRCENNICCCYSIFPWKIDKDKIEKVFHHCNELNMEQLRGTFIINRVENEEHISIRCSTVVIDDLDIVASLKELILAHVSITLHYWEKIYELLR